MYYLYNTIQTWNNYTYTKAKWNIKMSQCIDKKNVQMKVWVMGESYVTVYGHTRLVNL